MKIERSRMRAAVVAAFLGAAVTSTACGDDDDDGGTAATGGRSGSGGATPTGGATPNGGTPGTGGAAGSSEVPATGGAGSPGAAGAGGGGAGGAGGAGGDFGGGAGGEAGGAGGEGGDTVSEGGAGGDPSEGSGGANDGRDVYRPELREFNEELLKGLSLPPSFSINVFANGITNARMLAVHGDHVYVTRPKQGDVLRFVDDEGDGASESTAVAASDLPNVHGIVFHDDEVFLATDKRIYRGTVTPEGDFEGLTEIVDDLPDGGQHPNRTMGVDADDLLYVSIGSTCNACAETNPEHATVLRMPLDGSTRSVFASGLRNTIGFDWHPDTLELWGMDHGSDWLGNDSPPEELNLLESGNDYGWPYCYGKQEIDPVIQDPPDTTKEEYCAATVPSTEEYQAHGAPIGMVFYDGDAFPAEYQGDAFIAMHGSWNRFPPTGYSIVRATFEDGEPTGFEDFVTGFLIEDGTAQFGRPAGITVGPDGALLFSDDDNGVIYRVTYEDD